MIKHAPKSSARLFAEPEAPSAHLDGAYTANIDGAARGNPGPASYGVVVRRPDGTPIESLGKYIGRHTNNVAEYYALIAALDYAAAKGIKRLRVQSDSQLIVNQMKGLYKVKHPDLRPLHERARKQASGLEAFTIQYVPREQNRAADAAANAALDNTGGAQRAASGPAAEKNIAPQKALRSSHFTTRKIRARYRNGVLVPAEPLDLAEGTEVELNILPLAGN
jgi:ribonuclease HI